MEKEAKIVNSTKSHTAMRSAKSALLLFSLNSRRHHQEKETMDEAIENLKVEIVKERYKRRNLKLFNHLQFTLLIVVLFSLLTFFIFLAF